MRKIVFMVRFHSNYQGKAWKNYFIEVLSGKLLYYQGEEKRCLGRASTPTQTILWKP